MAVLQLLLAKTGGELRQVHDALVRHHYLHKSVDVRSRPLTYLIHADGEFAGCLVFGRPESTRCLRNSWYGSVEDVQAGRCRLTRWQVLNLARVWLHPSIQAGGAQYTLNAATQMIAQALRQVGRDYLLAHPPCFLDEPWEIREVLSYCNAAVHRGTLYRAANFRFMHVNERSIQTWAIPVRRLTHVERRAIEQQSLDSYRSKRYRSMRAVAATRQSPLFAPVEKGTV